MLSVYFLILKLQSKLQYFGARYLDPTTGRFLRVDPANYGPSWYTYANNNPLKYVDPDGEEPINMYAFDTFTLEEYNSFKTNLKNEFRAYELLKLEEREKYYLAVNPNYKYKRGDAEISANRFKKGMDLREKVDMDPEKGWNGKDIPHILDADLVSLWSSAYNDEAIDILEKNGIDMKLKQTESFAHELVHLFSGHGEVIPTSVLVALSVRKYGKLFNPVSVAQMIYLAKRITSYRDDAYGSVEFKAEEKKRFDRIADNFYEYTMATPWYEEYLCYHEKSWEEIPTKFRVLLVDMYNIGNRELKKMDDKYSGQ